MNKREGIARWLLSVYTDICYAEAEDIFQEAAVEMWLAYKNDKLQMGSNMTGMVMKSCRNIHNHHVRKVDPTVSWPDHYDATEDSLEGDYGFEPTEKVRKLRLESVYNELDKLSPDDREFMKMVLQKKSAKELMAIWKLKNPQVVRNKKCKIVARLRKALNGQEFDSCPSFFVPSQKFIHKTGRFIQDSIIPAVLS